METFLLSLLHKTTPKSLLQLHCHLITSAIHRRKLSQTSIILWNTLVGHYSQSPSPHRSLLLYKQMIDIFTPDFPFDTFSFSFLLKSCANSSNPVNGSQLHSLVIKNGFALHLYVHTSLVDMYSNCGLLANAKKAFDEMPERSFVSWNTMITGFAKWGDIQEARLLFEQMPDPDAVSWTILINGYSQIRRPDEAVVMFRSMLEKGGVMPTEITIFALIASVSDLGSVVLGETMHAYYQKTGMITSDVRVANSLIDMYAKCGSIENAKKMFNLLSDGRTLVSWTSIINALATHGMAKEALILFEEMTKTITPNRVTFLCVLNACNHGGLVEDGLRNFLSMVFEWRIEPDVKHYGCLIDMLGRAGRLEEAEKTIVRMPMKVSVVVWRALLGCCSRYAEVEMGERVVRRIVEMEEGRECVGDFVVLCNMYTEAGRFEEAERVRRRVDDEGLVKVPGSSFIGGARIWKNG